MLFDKVQALLGPKQASLAKTEDSDGHFCHHFPRPSQAQAVSPPYRQSASQLLAISVLGLTMRDSSFKHRFVVSFLYLRGRAFCCCCDFNRHSFARSLPPLDINVGLCDLQKHNSEESVFRAGLRSTQGANEPARQINSVSIKLHYVVYINVNGKIQKLMNSLLPHPQRDLKAYDIPSSFLTVM